LLPSGGFFICGLPTLTLHGINSDSAGNYQLIDVESTVRLFFCQELPAKEQEIHPRNGIPLGFSGSASTTPIYYEGQLF
jgi:hypothetical protein